MGGYGLERGAANGFLKGTPSMSGQEPAPDKPLDLRHPLIRQVGELTAELMGFRLLVVYPTASGWGQVHGDSRADLQPRFCKLFQASPEGARHCRMCHILMSVAACSGGPAEQRCHAGAFVIVCPAANSSSESVAIVCSCMLVDARGWEETRTRGEELGLDLRELRKAFLELPKADESQRQRLRSATETMALAVRLVRRSAALEAELATAHEAPRAETRSRAEIREWIEKTGWAPRSGETGGRPLLIRIVCELIRQRPGLPLTVKELAAAARLTPNHFTTLFRQHTGTPFSEYLVEQRLARAKKLLGNPTLTVREIAHRVGYNDPGYFTRRFRQKTALSPLQWRTRKAEPASTE